MNLERDGAEHWRHLCSPLSTSHPDTVSVPMIFACFHSTVSKASRQALILLTGTLSGGRAMATSIDVIRQKMETHPFAQRVFVQYIKGHFKESLTDGLIERLKAFPPAIVRGVE